MGEIDPTYHMGGLNVLRLSTLRPQVVRKVLWFASSQIMADKRFNESDRRQVGKYMETIFRAVDNSEKQDAVLTENEKHPVNTPLNMGSMMSWAFTDVYRETFPDGFDSTNRVHRDTKVHMRLNLGLTEAHLGDAYQKYLQQQEAQARDAA